MDKNNIEMPVWQKACLTVEEASAFSNIGIVTLREITRSPRCSFVLRIGNKRLIKRKEFLEYISKTTDL